MDRAAFEQLALAHIDAVHRMAMQLARRPDEAADLVQETYLKALRACGSFEERGAGVRAWLFKILHNVFFSRLRQDKRGPIVTPDFQDDASGQPGPGEPVPAWNLATLDWEQVDGRIKAALDSLRPEYRSILLLWGVEGIKYREIAEIQNIPIGTVMSRLHRARAILAAQLAPLAEEIGARRR